MPDHLHVIAAPTRDREARVGNFSGALKRWIREDLSASWKWQPGCFDRLFRSNHFMRNGDIFRKILCVPGLLAIPGIWHIKSG